MEQQSHLLDLFFGFVGEVSPVLAQPGQQRHLRGLRRHVSERGGQRRLPGQRDDPHRREGEWKRPAGTCSRLLTKAQLLLVSRSGPEEVCCHGDQCGLFFFWMRLNTGLILDAGYRDNPTTPMQMKRARGG